MSHSPARISQDRKARPIQNALLCCPTGDEPSSAFSKESTTFPSLPQHELQRDLDSIPDETDEAASSQSGTMMAEDEDADGRGCGAPRNATLKRRRDDDEENLSTQCERECKFRSRSAKFVLI